MGKFYKLTRGELVQAAMIAVERNIQAKIDGLPDRYGYEGPGWTQHIEGALGEIAVAKALGVYWNGSIGTFQAGGDVSGLEVRTRIKEKNRKWSFYDLIIRRDNKPPNTVYVHVVSECPTYNVVGWIRDWEGKKNEYLQDYGERDIAYFVPQTALHPIKELFLCVCNEN